MSEGAARGWDRWRLGWLLLAAVFVGPLGYVGPLGFMLLVVIPAVALIPAVRFKSWPWAFAALCALLAWACITWTWSPSAATWSADRILDDLGGSVALKLALLLPLCTVFVVAADRLRQTSARVVSVVLACGVVVLSAILLFEGLTEAALYRVIQPDMRTDLAFRNAGRGAFVASVLFWPLAGVLARRFGAGVWIALAAGAAIVAASVLLGVTAAAVAVLAGGVVLLAFRMAPTLAGWAAAAGVAAFTLAAPWLVSLLPNTAGQPASWAARIDIWRVIAARAQERPLTGWGLDASRTFGISLHPHNSPLQMWAELGILGALAFCVFWSLVFLVSGRVARQDPILGGLWAAGAAAYFVIGALSFGAWQEWWLGLGALAFASALMLRRGWSGVVAPAPRVVELAPLN